MDDVSAPMTNPGSTHMPDDHAGHDRQLVVAFASGDLPAEDVADAERLRGSALTRLMRRLASPRLQVLQPLAGAAMVIGLLLVVAPADDRSGSGAAIGPSSALDSGAAVGSGSSFV